MKEIDGDKSQELMMVNHDTFEPYEGEPDINRLISAMRGEEVDRGRERVARAPAIEHPWPASYHGHKHRVLVGKLLGPRVYALSSHLCSVVGREGQDRVLRQAQALERVLSRFRELTPFHSQITAHIYYRGNMLDVDGT